MTNIKTRLAFIFTALGLLCIAIATVGMYGMADANERANRAYQEITLPSQYLQANYRFQLIQALNLLEANLMNDVTVSKSQLDLVRQLYPAAEEQAKLFEQSKKPESVKQLAEEYLRNRKLSLDGLMEAAQLTAKGDAPGSMEIVAKKVRPPGIVAAITVDKLITLHNKEADIEHEQAVNTYRRLRAWMLGVLTTGGILCGLAVWLQMRNISESLGGIQNTLHEVSSSLDLTQRATIRRQDEIGRTAFAFNELIQRVGEAISSVRIATDSVHIAAREIASGNIDLSSRTEEQAAALDQTASNMTQLTDTVKKNADNAQKANTLANQATILADKGDTAVQAMVQTIGNISDGAARISDITGLIEGIAFQTNILALNAAVEAARAGEQGRGFAVVASEVRDLAQRSSAAAKEIKLLIDSSAAMVQDGTKQATEVGTTVSQVRQAIKQVYDVVSEIAAASHAQSMGISRISEAIVQMDAVTQQNAALVEQSAAAAQLLEDQANRLKSAVSAFKVSTADSAMPQKTLRLAR